MEDREKIAAEMHAIWSHWLAYVVSRGVPNERGDIIIPANFVGRWMLQMDIPYDKLTEDEKETDRLQADKIIAIIRETRRE